MRVEAIKRMKKRKLPEYSTNSVELKEYQRHQMSKLNLELELKTRRNMMKLKMGCFRILKKL